MSIHYLYTLTPAERTKLVAAGIIKLPPPEPTKFEKRVEKARKKRK